MDRRNDRRVTATATKISACVLAILWQPALAQQIDTSGCTSTFLSDNGLEFYTDCSSGTGSSQTNLTVFWGWNETSSVEECMNKCAITRPRCYAVVFDDEVCNMYDEGGFPEQVSGEKAVANATQLATPDEEGLACPYDTYSYHTTESGQDFQILCGQDFGVDAGNLCPYEGYPFKCTRHADSLVDCMQYCSEAHPLCKGVSWNADMIGGYGNCYLKVNPGETFVTEVVTHSARMTENVYDDMDTACPATSPYTVAGDNYTVTCRVGASGTANITPVHSGTLDTCLGECSSSIENGCQGVLFDMSLVNGYRNCYLLNETGTPTTGGANSSFAILAAVGAGPSTNSSTPPQDSSNSQGGGGSKAWIAEPVVGALSAIAIAIAIVGSGALWWRRRRARASAPDKSPHAEEPKGPGKAFLPAQPIEKGGEPEVRHELHDPRNERHEMRDANSERLWPSEMRA